MDNRSRSSTISEAAEHGSLPPTPASLSPAQKAALAELKCLCVMHNVYWHAHKVEGKRIVRSNDDITLLRYLRARGYVPQAAFKQYSATVAWRRNLRLDNMYKNADLAEFEAIRRLFPQWTGRRDRRGVPVFVYSVSNIKPEDVLATSRSDPGLSSVFLPAEYSTQFVQPLCARMHVDRAMPCLIHIIDLSGVGVRHFWKLRAHLQKASMMATAHYPESVDKIFILGAPSFFPTIWGFITKWFEPSLTSKISVLPASEVKPTLSDYIDEDDLPQRFGGTLDWEYGMHPDLDDEARALVGRLADEWVEGPLRYIPGEDGDRIVLAGAEGKSVRNEVLVEIPRQYPALDSEED